MSLQHYLVLEKTEGYKSKAVVITINGVPLTTNISKYNSGLCTVEIPEQTFNIGGIVTEIAAPITGDTADILPTNIHLLDCVISIGGAPMRSFLKIDPAGGDWKFQLGAIANITGAVIIKRNTYRWVVARDF